MQSSQRCFCWLFLFRGLRDSALCCTDPPLRSLLLLLFFLGLFRLVSCGCLLLRLFLGETPAWQLPLVRVVVLAPASAFFRNGLLPARSICFPLARSATAVGACFAASKTFFIFLDECADDAALRHFVELFASSCSSIQLDAAT
jgi:hypothetical protein